MRAVHGASRGVERGLVDPRGHGRAADGARALRDGVEGRAEEGYFARHREAEGDGRVEVAAAERGRDVDEGEDEESWGPAEGGGGGGRRAKHQQPAGRPSGEAEEARRGAPKVPAIMTWGAAPMVVVARSMASRITW